jgi:hypothetical protein
MGVPHIADPILDPIHFGFSGSIERYAALRRERPDVEILMGTGNLTELTDADSGGIAALLLGICSELAIRNVLVVQVSPHTCRTVQEHDVARRLMFRARADASPPKGYGGGCSSLHERRPVAANPAEIAAVAAQVRDTNFRIEVSTDGVHIYNRDGHAVSTDPFEVFPRAEGRKRRRARLRSGDELAKAEIAFRLGKRYAQDTPLDWGVAVDRPATDRTRHAPAGPTLSRSADAAHRRDHHHDNGRGGRPRYRAIGPYRSRRLLHHRAVSPPSRTLDNLRAIPSRPPATPTMSASSRAA